MVSIVTGAGSGIGRATAVALAGGGGAGSVVVLVGRRAESPQETASSVERAGGRPVVQTADISRPEDVERLREVAEHQGGAVDVLVNNAGVNVPARALDRLGIGDWEQILRVNATGPFLMTRAVLPGMRRRRRGTIVNVSSMAGIRPSRLAGPAYSAAKAALISFTESINGSERRYGIRACAVCPGEVATPILDDRPVPPPRAARELMLQPDDVASTIVHVVTLPQRALIDLLTIVPTVQRDASAETT